MKKEIMRIGQAILSATFLIACSNSSIDESAVDSQKQPMDSFIVNMLPKTHAVTLTQKQEALVQQSNVFSFNFYRTINEVGIKSSNIISPLSVAYILGMLNAGAQGITAQEISKALGLSDNSKETINDYFKALIEQAPTVDPSVTLQLANIVVANYGLSLEKRFAQEMHDYYDAEVATLNFGEPSALDYLNDWCRENTGGMISKIADELDPYTVLAMMNAIYFKATWTEKFDVADTRNETFYKEDGKTASLPMMYRKAQALYGRTDIYSQLCLPFGSGSAWEMYVLLPNNGKTVGDVINSLTDKTWEVSTDKYIVDVKIPRFSTTSDLELNDVISKIGIPSIFDPKTSNLPDICKDERLYVSKIKQKAAIEVNEEGTKTTAVTIADMALSASPKTYLKTEFNCNRPFVYLIRESGSGAIFFIGTYRGE